MKLTKFLSVISLFSLIFMGCTSTKKDWGFTQNLEKLSSAFYKRGYASFYGEKWTGKKTANGETFDSKLLTAASKTIPFNTRVLVKDVRTNRFVIVRINDRGPYVDDKRIIDLSETAAKKLGIYRRGIAKVDLYILKSTTTI